MAAAPRLDSSVIDRLFDRSRAEHWDVPRERFEAAIQASLNHAFSNINPTSSEVSEYLDDLHVEDLALAIACEAGGDRAWEHFVSEYRPLLHRAADAIDPAGGAREVADAIYAELYGLSERDGTRRSLLRYFHGRSKLGTWLRAVLSQRWVDRVRAGRRSTPLPDDLERLPERAGSGEAKSSPLSSVESGRFRGLAQEALAGAIAALPARDRLRLSCYYAQGLKLAAIGKLLREHEATVSRQLAKTRDGLADAVRTSLKRDHGMDDRTVAECLASAMEDTGSMDVNELIGTGAFDVAPASRAQEIAARSFQRIGEGVDRLLKDAMKTRMTQPIDCPDAEQLAAWADGTIYGADAEGIESHLADCERCQAVLAAFVATDPASALVAVPPTEAQAPIEHAPQARAPRPARRAPYVWWGAVAASLLVWLMWPRPPQVEPPVDQIARSETVPPAAGSVPTPQGQAAVTPAPAPVTAQAPKPEAAAMAKTSPVRPQTNQPAQLAEPLPKPASPPPATVAGLPPPATVPPDMIQTLPRSKPVSDAVMIQTASKSDLGTMSYLVRLPDGGVEFGPTDAVADVTLTPTRQGQASGGGGAGGGGRASSSARANPLKAIRWRVMLSGIVEKTIDGGANWRRIVLDPAIAITTGASPSAVVCWLAGKAGAVLKSTDGGATFVRVTVPVSSDLVSITASDALVATVATSDGQRLTTLDGGQTWVR